MWRRFRPPLALVAAALLGLIALLAVLQYRWLGQISDAERTQRRTTLAAGALEFAQDFDREITRAYLLFQADTPIEPMTNEQELAGRFAARYDRWQATARFPRLVNEFYSFSPDHRDAAGGRSGVADLRRFDPATRRLEPVEWPASMKDWRDQLAVATWQDSSSSTNALFIRKIPSAIWESAPAIVVPTPVIVLGEPKPGRPDGGGDVVLAAGHRSRVRRPRAAAVAGDALLWSRRWRRATPALASTSRSPS